MTDLAVDRLTAPLVRANPDGSTLYGDLLALMPHNKFDSYRTGTLRKLVSISKIMGFHLAEQSPCQAKIYIHSYSRSPHINFSAFGLVVYDKKILQDSAGVNCPLTALQGRIQMESTI